LKVRIRTPIGVLRLTGNDRGWTHLVYEDPGRTGSVKMVDRSAPRPWSKRMVTWFAPYFSGTPPSFSPLTAPDGTAFQCRVWHRLRTVPFGQTVTYGHLAEMLGDRDIARAVGGACGANPLPILIPCHRVVRSDGRTGGYSGPNGMKKRLLNQEKTGYST